MSRSALPFPALNDTSLLGIAERKLFALGEAIGKARVLRDAAAGLAALMGPWGKWTVDRGPHWPTDLTDDMSPFEFSLSFHRAGVDLRFLLESQSEPLTNESSWHAGLQLNARLAELYGADLSQFEAIKDLFAPIASIPARFLLWHSAVFHADGSAPMFKAYLNPQVVGPDAAARLVERALKDLGAPRAWEFIAANVDESCRFVYFSLDLVARERARIKVYLAHPNATAADIAARTRRPGGNDFGDTEALVEKLTGTKGPFSGRPILTCFAFRPGESDPRMTLHVPVRSYVRDDGEALDRICRVLDEDQGRTLRRAVSSIADRSLESGRGLVTYVSLREEPSARSVTVYLSPELYAVSHARPSSIPPSSGPAPLVSMIRELKPGRTSESLTLEDVQTTVTHHQQLLALHPFLNRLEGTPSFDQARVVAQRLAFFVMCFQDVLRLVHSSITDPELKQLAKLHALEDAGHDHWYLHDLARFGIACDVGWLFSEEHERTRDVAYSQIADVLRSSDDASRMAVALSLEAAGSEFFRRMIEALERLGQAEGLKYFARDHEQVEKDHEIFDDASRERFRQIRISSATAAEVLAVVDRTFASMTKLADDLESALAKFDPPPDSSVSPLSNRPLVA